MFTNGKKGIWGGMRFRLEQVGRRKKRVFSRRGAEGAEKRRNILDRIDGMDKIGMKKKWKKRMEWWAEKDRIKEYLGI